MVVLKPQCAGVSSYWFTVGSIYSSHHSYFRRLFDVLMHVCLGFFYFLNDSCPKFIPGYTFASFPPVYCCLRSRLPQLLVHECLVILMSLFTVASIILMP